MKLADNDKNIALEIEGLDGELPVYRGFNLSENDIMRRDIIQRLRKNFHLNIKEIEKKYDIDFNIYFESELPDFEKFVDDELVEVTDDTILITEVGHQFTNIICRVFDKYYKGEILAKDLGERTLNGDTFSKQT
jgi:oxygen-independent coproporphyrinogen III oxidase